MKPRSADRMSERRLDAIIVAATLAVIVIAVIALVAIVDSVEQRSGDGARDVPAFVD